jgi:hypothetical protein
MKKEDILRSARNVIDVEIPDLGMVKIRPLNYYESTLIESMALKKMTFGGLDVNKVKGNMDDAALRQMMMQQLDGDKVGQLQINEADAVCQIVAWCLLDDDGKPALTVEEVKLLAPGVPKAIAEKVKEITGMGVNMADAERFRKN